MNQRPQSSRFTVGQRWISTAEPELGLGSITAVANRRVEIRFSTHATTRLYALEDAPLQRIIFSAGNRVKNTKGKEYKVVSVDEDLSTGLVTYHCGQTVIPESDLADTIAFSTPQQRLSAGIADSITDFTFRCTMVRERLAITGSPVRGFVGGRIELIPHQLYIAGKATAQPKIRVLLADETGLGKTIEACLMLHRCIITGQVVRALILVPDALVHQWFVELLRRFNITCRLCSEEQADEEGPEGEWFNDDPLWICSRATVRRYPTILRQLERARWDMVIVDEAHHIALKDPFFGILETFAANGCSMILLSATPEQFGRKGHFSRLRLLDQHRYTTPESYGNEVQRLRTVSRHLEELQSGDDGSIASDTAVPLDDELRQLLVNRGDMNDNDTPVLPETFTVAQLIDLFGVGRAYLRNTRRTVSGFPDREVFIIPLDPPDTTGADPHTVWIAGFLKRHPKRKVLVITSTITAAVTLRDALQKIIAIDVALFHEEMTLLQRDRQAAWFAEPHGPRILVCSESGSEGRNFQFCSDLILLDLPWNPELLEQRIGRLDRIGQKHTIAIHVPVVKGSGEALLCRWYHEGVKALEKNVPAAGMVFEEMRARLEQCAATPDDTAAIAALLYDTRKRTDELTADLFGHRDFLLECASNNLPQALRLIHNIEKESTGNRTARLINGLFGHFGIKTEEAGDRRLALITEFCTDHAFPLPRAERPVITFDRTTACSHDMVEFLTIDHPMVTGALDLYLSSPHGTASFALWNDPDVTELLLESMFVMECIAPVELRLFRFFTPQPLRMVVNHHLQAVTDRYPPELLDAHGRNGPVEKLITQKKLIEVTFPRLLEAAEQLAHEQTIPVITNVKETIRKTYTEERQRLSVLRSLGATIVPGETENLKREESELLGHLDATRVRCDAIRLIWRGPVKGE
ncbi:MAG: DEAD/DEAH box helicase family protein [Chitinispirillaceae bacterium]|nr:DEAD/DEAH box helicase family protein [Chitinispirillaceae bacterium]